MIKTESYVQEAAGGMVYRLIPVTEEIIRCVIGKEEIREPESLIIEKKDYPEVVFEAEEKEGRLNVRTKKVLVSLNLSEGCVEWKHADGSKWCTQNKADLTKIDVVRYTTGGEKPIINRVKTVDGERNFIQNLKPERYVRAIVPEFSLTGMRRKRFTALDRLRREFIITAAIISIFTSII